MPSTLPIITLKIALYIYVMILSNHIDIVRFGYKGLS